MDKRFVTQSRYGSIYKGPDREDLMSNGQKGINKPFWMGDIGTSVIGHHIKTKSDPVIPVIVQAKCKLNELRRMKRPNLEGI